MHTLNLLRAFAAIAAQTETTSKPRIPRLMRPRFILEQSHDTLPSDLLWGQWFDWDVDDTEFATPGDIWQCVRNDPDRCEVVDIYDNNALTKIDESDKEVLVLHM